MSARDRRRGRLPPWRACLCIAALIAMATRSAQPVQAAAPRLAVAVADCVGVPPAEVRRDVAIELDALLVEAGHEHPLDTTRVQLGCEGAFIRVEVTDPLSGKLVSRRIDPGREPATGRARLLALAVVELVAASWLELSVRKAPPAAAVDATANANARESAEESLRRVAPHVGARAGRERQWRLLATVMMREFTSAPAARALGLGIAAERDLHHVLTAALDLSLERAQRDTAFGGVHAQALSLAPAGLLRARWGALALSAGLGARLGVLRVRGEPDLPRWPAQGSDFVAAWGGPTLLTRARVHLGRRVLVAIGAEAGWVALPVAAQVVGASELRMDGAWVSAHLGFGFTGGAL